MAETENFTMAPATITNEDIFITEDWCYTKKPQDTGNIDGGIGVHWKLYYSGNHTNKYKLQYQFYVWCSVKSSAAFTIRSTPITINQYPYYGDGFLRINCNITDNENNTFSKDVFKIPFTTVNTDSWFSMIQASSNYPPFCWIPLNYYFTFNQDSNYYRLEDFYKNFLIYWKYLRLDENTPLTIDDLDNKYYFPSFPNGNNGVTSILNSYSSAGSDSPKTNNITCKHAVEFTLSHPIKNIKVFLHCYHIRIARYINSNLYSTGEINGGACYHGSNDSISHAININDFISNQSQLSIDLGQNKKIKAEDINTLQASVYNEIEKRRKRYSNPETWPTTADKAMENISVTANTIIDKNPEIINNIINKGLKNTVFYDSSDTAIVNIANYSTTANNFINHLNDAVETINTLTSKSIRHTFSTTTPTTAQYLEASGCNNGYCTGLCTNACTSICMNTCGFCALSCFQDCMTSCGTACSSNCGGQCKGSGDSSATDCPNCNNRCHINCTQQCVTQVDVHSFIPIT